MIPDLVPVEGARRKVLPLGRYLASLDEVGQKFACDANRQNIWKGFLNFLRLVQGCVGKVAEVWIGGSFITSEEIPHDIDVVFLIEEQIYSHSRLNDKGSFALRFFDGSDAQLRTTVKETFRIDPYLLVVSPTKIKADPATYMIMRGYWDQFWSKTRFVNAEDPRWEYPQAGFLEVKVDGYN